MDVTVYVVLLAIGLVVLIATGVVFFRLARAATPAYKAKRRNEAKLSLWLAAVVAGSLLAGILNLASVNPQTVGWPMSWGLTVICGGLWVAGFIGSIRCLIRMYRIGAQVDAEEEGHPLQE